MRPQILIPLMLLVLSCMSAVAHAGGADRLGTHAHIHHHSGSSHQHVHTHSRDHAQAPSSDHTDDTCQDSESSDHEHCCSEHDHHPEPAADGLTSRNRDLPIYTAAIVTTIPDFFNQRSPKALRNWAPLRQRPPDHLGSLRTVIMLN